MRRPTFQFTIRQLLTWVVLVAVVCFLHAIRKWPILLALGIFPIAFEFSIDRSSRGLGLLGSMLGGFLGFGMMGVLWGFSIAITEGPQAIGPFPQLFFTSLGLYGFVLRAIYGLTAATFLFFAARFRRVALARERRSRRI